MPNQWPLTPVPAGHIGNTDADLNVPGSDNPLEWQSMTGVDMVCAFRFDQEFYDATQEPSQSPYHVFAELQTVSVSGTRSVSAVRALGESAARTYTRGARTIAGSLIFAMFNEDPLNRVARLSPDHEVYSPQEPFFVDQIPEFDIIVSAVNEYGAYSQALIGGVTLTNYGTTLSIHDIYTEISYTYVARFFIPMTADLKISDKVRQLELDPLWKRASVESQIYLGTPPTREDALAESLRAKHGKDTSTGRFVREFEV